MVTQWETLVSLEVWRVSPLLCLNSLHPSTTQSQAIIPFGVCKLPKRSVYVD